ncbi:MAG: F0F1 ATP synthase subunit delta [Candidatus Omnitrophica bacterium]|nr:F0F1 ATP synthase subunit delta [Candidatus Omnitrophota bacterium]
MLIKLLLSQVFIFAGIVFFLRFLFLRHFKSALSRLNKLHEDNLAKEEELNEELRRAKQQSEAVIAQSRQDAEAVIAAAGKEAQAARFKIEESARAQAEKIISSSRLDCEKIKESGLKEIHAQGVDFALKLISELFTEEDRASLQHELAGGVIEEISRLPKERFNITSGKAGVVSSFPLLEKQADDIKNILSQKTGRDIGLEQRLDPGIIGGLVLEMGGMVIDGTLKNKLQKLVSRIK